MLYIILNMVELFNEAFDMEVDELGFEFAREQHMAIGEDLEHFDAEGTKYTLIKLATNVTFNVNYYSRRAEGETKFPFFLMICDRGGAWM